MDTSPGQRTLAAIVFTDTVGFSQLVGKDEEGTLKLVKKDLDLMTHLCDRFGGRVVKTTGDGLMMIFSSAVQAVNCSLDIQRILTEQARHDRSALKHRIGVHLGDVIVSGDDALGDGVNIAARLEQESEPGGICMSQVVYDVVKGRMFLEAAKIGELRLKNIAEPIGAYKVAGVGKAKPHKKARNLAPVWGAASALVLVSAAIAGVLIDRALRDSSGKRPADTGLERLAAKTMISNDVPTAAKPPEQKAQASKPEPQDPTPPTQPPSGVSASKTTSPPQSTSDAKDAVVNEPSPGAGSQSGDDRLVDDEPTPTPPTAQDPGPNQQSVLNPFDAAWKQYARKYDYTAMADWVRTNPADVPNGAAPGLQARYESLAGLIDWTQTALSKTSAQSPFQIGWKGNPGTVWQQPNGRLMVVLPNNRYLRKLSGFGPILVASIIRGLIATSQVDANMKVTLLDEVKELVSDANEHKPPPS